MVYPYRSIWRNPITSVRTAIVFAGYTDYVPGLRSPCSTACS
jgi:hypothetical protein